MERNMDIIFVRDYKSFISTFKQKEKGDYILNVSKIIKDKFNTKFLIPNKVQSFLLNYEIKKLLDKAINLKNKKYNRIIYLNLNLSTTSILNTTEFISEEYPDFIFKYYLIDSSDDDYSSTINDKVEIIKVV
ncbi:hypothetical protein UFOVP699_303 [uncultured Caudovirales phage]|uniref:Uncharacterized protein n=1 Tax=uncultured Caudovirales phage TaxID=2100421 RepID=A0A6J5NL22_9CAUD|nr:hypothetical protein UFOVP699_303 [uncultured Caudovirales phage]